uniref:ARIP4 Helicase n=1 Tax=Echinostoma caproni TaxID=27848 RepID=A0A183AI25_9TREM
LSDGDDEPEEEEEEVETEICELQDASSYADADGKIVLNPNRTDENEPEVLLPPQIARVIKPHQVSGVRFLYDNVVESLERFHQTDGFGCILAHSMGLGKTIQIIGFLESLFRYCKAQRVLVVVPINTIQNWQAEFEMWVPSDTSKRTAQQSVKSEPPSANNENCETAESRDDLEVSETNIFESPALKSTSTFESTDAEQTAEGESDHGMCEASESPNIKASLNPCVRSFKLFVVRDVIKTMTQRHEIICQWFTEGGVLLLGYEMFRLLLNQKRTPPAPTLLKTEVRGKRRKKALCVDLEKEEKKEKMLADFHTALLDPGPQLVICDEGHRIKNSEASISKALKAIRTRRRVVLTGYPLQNNLMEYWCMVDFVRPNYLGTKQEFTNMFQRPIENGQCIDSTPEDRKIMQGRAHVLHDLLSGFVQRRSHAVLKASLPPKTEIVLLIKLSPLQRTLYAAFMRSLNSIGPLGWAQVNTLKTYAMCCKIWNHPDILWRAMEEHKEAMDFDIEDPSASGAMAAKGMHRSTTTTNMSTANANQTVFPNLNMHTGASTAFSGGTQPTANTNAWQSQATTAGVNFPFPNAQNQEVQNLTVPSVSNPGLTSPPSLPASMYSHNSSQASNVGTYDWASDSELWGPEFKPGNVEHSGKIMIFLSLLEGCVMAGDKLLVFTQSLFTLDLLERILRQLPLPKTELTDEKNRSSANSSLEEQSNLTAPILQPAGISQNTSDRDTMNTPEAPQILECEPPTVTFPPTEDGLAEGTLDESHVMNSTSIISDKCEIVTPNTGSEENKDVPNHATNPLLEFEGEETLRSLHYRLASRLGSLNQPTVWTKNVHYFRLDGSTTASEREKLINHFNDPKNPAKLFLVSTRAGCLGVNLIGANRVVVFDASWNPCHDCQAVCRVYRYGQVKPCYIYRLVSDNTMEKKIYDRQVTKQGMSDRVVDELNPSQQFTRSQVELLMSFEDKDLESISDNDLEKCADLIKPDPVLATVLEKHKGWITKTPFTHESLLIDRKDYRLTRVEKRMAKQRYEQEKRLSLSYQQAHLFQLQRMQALQQQQLLAAGINPALVDTSRFMPRTPAILSRSNLNYRATYTSGMAALDAMRQVEHGTFRNPECKVTRIVATSDLYFPSTTNSTTTQRKIPKGEVMEVIQTSKGKYLRITRTGDLFVVKTNASTTQSSESSTGQTSAEDSSQPVSSTGAPSTTAAGTAVDKPQLQLPGMDNDRASSLEDGDSKNSKMISSKTSSHSGSSISNDRLGDDARSVSSIGQRSSKTDHGLGSAPSLGQESARTSYGSDAIRFPRADCATDASSANQQQRFTSASESQGSNDSSFSHLSPLRPPKAVDLNQPQFPASTQLRSPTATASTPTAVAAHTVRTPEPYSAQTAPTRAAHQNDTRSASEEQYHKTSRQLEQNQLNSWLCQTCGRPALMGCICQTNSRQHTGSEKPSVQEATPAHTSSGSGKGREVACASFTGSTGVGDASTQSSRENSFLSSNSYDSGFAAQYYQAAAVQRQHEQQQQQQYLRAAEKVARQSAAAAYMNLNKQAQAQAQAQVQAQAQAQAQAAQAQHSTTSGSHHSGAIQTPPPPSRRDFGLLNQGQNMTSPQHMLSHNSSSLHTTASVSSSFPSSPVQSPASVVHEYFAHLAGQQQAARFSVPSQDSAQSHSVTSAMQQYLAAGNHQTHAQSNSTVGADFYAHLSQRHFDHNNQSRAVTTQQVASTEHPTRPDASRSQFAFGSPTAHSTVTPFDRLQASNLLPNFRFP